VSHVEYALTGQRYRRTYGRHFVTLRFLLDEARRLSGMTCYMDQEDVQCGRAVLDRRMVCVYRAMQLVKMRNSFFHDCYKISVLWPFLGSFHKRNLVTFAERVNQL